MLNIFKNKFFSFIKNKIQKININKTCKNIDKTCKNIEFLLSNKDCKNIEKSLSDYDGYVEYVGDFFDSTYIYTNSKNIAELLMYERIHNIFGKDVLSIETKDIPWPLNTIDAIYDIMDNGCRSKFRRIYYKVKIIKKQQLITG